MSKTLSKTLIAAAIALTLANAAAHAADSGEPAEMAAVLKAPITPDKAVAIAEQAGGRAYGFGMEVASRGHWYEVDVLRDGKPVEVRIDSDNGKLLGSSAARGEDTAGAHALDGGKLTLGAGIAAAERAGAGPALEANAVGSGANAHVVVDIVKGNAIAHYRVTMIDGTINVVKTATN